MQRARRSAMPSRPPIPASTSTPASVVRRPPSKAAHTSLPATAAEKALRSCRSMTRSAVVHDRLRPSGQTRLIKEMGVDVGAWLHGLGLERYERAFRDNDVDAGVLPELTADDLIGLGVSSIGHRRNLLAAIAALRESVSSPEARPVQAESAPPTTDPAPRSREAERRQLTVMFV